MSDFDKFFAEKLDEEGQFPRREKNWRTLSKRLEAFDTGLQQQTGNIHRYLRYWQAVAACTIFATGFLTWKVSSVQNENAALRKEAAEWQEKYKAVLSQASTLETAPGLSDSMKNDSPAPAAQSVESFDTAIKTRGNKEEIGEIMRKTEKKHRVQSKKANIGRSVTKEVVRNNSDALNPVAFEETPPSSGQINAADSLIFKNTMDNLSALQMLPADSLHAIVVTLLSKVDLDRPSPPDARAETIKPVTEPSRFRAGIQVMTGFPVPKEKGVSLLLGNGISVEYNLWRDFWLTGSADWLRYDVSTEKYVPKFHSHHHNPPPPNNPQQEVLVKVESTQRQQQYALGLRYALPVRSWVRPAVRVAYALTRVSPELITFKFEDNGPGGPGGPKYKVQKSESQILDNIWRFGAGLEHETPRWVFSLWADYSKNFAAADLTFDALMLKAGIQYTFN
jgi:hypothetical protein